MAGKAYTSARQAAVAFVTFCGWFAAMSARTATAADWPNWRGPSRNGISSETGWLTTWPSSGPPRLWSANIGQSYAAVSVQGRRLYAIGARSGKETVTCLDDETGAVLWTYSHTHPKRTDSYDPNPTASTATPVVAGERVFVLTREGLAFCLQAKSGQLLWQRDLAGETGNGLPPFGCASSPVVHGSLVIYNVGKHGIALNQRTGAIIWNSGPGIAGHASPVFYQIDGREGVLLFTGSGLAGVDLPTGRLMWRHPWTSPNHLYAVDPVVSGDRIFISSYGRAQQLRLTGDAVSVVYDIRCLRSTFNNPVLVDGFLYGSDRGTLQCINWETGQEKWSRPDALLRPPGQEDQGERHNPMGEGGLIAAGRHLIILDESGTARLVSAVPEAYQERARVKVMQGPCWIAPVLAHGVLYCRNNNGDLSALDLRARKEKGTAAFARWR
jgi:outer membrane protein assembly factor BamB